MAGMQKKSINAYIDSRVKFWAWSFADPKALSKLLNTPESKDSYTEADKDKIKAFQSAVRENTIVTGGAIASMLLGEPVNDLDIYLIDKDIATQVAQYYLYLTFAETLTSKVSEIKVIDNDTGGVACYIKSMGVGGDDAGDFDDYSYFEMMSENDIDKFFNEHKARLKGEQPQHSVKFITSNAITLNNDIQIILRFTGDAQTIHKNYDFIHATNYWTRETGLVYHPDALQSLLEKRLVYVGSRFPVASLFRIRKFIERGFHISAGQITKIAFDVSRLNLLDPKVLSDQLIGVDYAYFNEVIRLLVNPTDENLSEAIDRTYLFKIIDMVYEGRSTDAIGLPQSEPCEPCEPESDD